MRIPLRDILETATDLEYAEQVEGLNRLLQAGKSPDYELTRPLEVHVSFYRAQSDLFFDGTVRGQAKATCARCLDSFPITIGKDFSFILAPEKPLLGEIELGAADLMQSFYAGTEVDLTALIYEQVLLTLPTRPLCAEECRGLCPRCGVNLNTGGCSCTAEAGDPRLAVLRNIKIDRGV